jgi:DNA-binding response OmpR family regulator
MRLRTAKKLTKTKIMIIDDDKIFLNELAEILTLNNYRVRKFSDGEVGLSMVGKVRPDIILLDLKMKGKSGFQVADEMKQLPELANIPIIAMTGVYTQEQNPMLVKIFGMTTCLMKPFTPTELFSQIEAVLVKH